MVRDLSRGLKTGGGNMASFPSREEKEVTLSPEMGARIRNSSGGTGLDFHERMDFTRYLSGNRNIYRNEVSHEVSKFR